MPTLGEFAKTPPIASRRRFPSWTPVFDLYGPGNEESNMAKGRLTF